MTISVNPSILIWARETAGFTCLEAAKKLQFKDSTKSTGVAKLAAMETGEKQPTRTQLNKFSNVYKRPLLVFYMAEPPRTGHRGQDFRQSLDNDSRTNRENAILDTLLRDVIARQKMVRNILLDDDFEPLNYVGSMPMQKEVSRKEVSRVVKDISKQLRFEHTDLKLRQGKPEKLFKSLRDATEKIGIFVLLKSDVGSWHSTIEANVFRGFAIADKFAPFVVINPKDAKAAHAFTLIHELAHIWLGQTGVSGGISSSKSLSKNSKIEQFCNDVAGEFLLPDGKFKDSAPEFNPSNLKEVQQMIDIVADRWSVSKPMVAYRLFRLKELSQETYQKLTQTYTAQWQDSRKRNKEKLKGSAASGPDYHTLKQHSLGKAFMEVIYRTVRDNALTYTKAANLLGIKPNAVEPLLRKYEDNRSNRDAIIYANSSS